MFTFAVYLLLGSFFAFAASIYITFNGDSEIDPDPVSVYVFTLLLWGPLVGFLIWDTTRFVRERNKPYEKILGSRLG